jgi:hypothetical protein
VKVKPSFGGTQERTQAHLTFSEGLSLIFVSK